MKSPAQCQQQVPKCSGATQNVQFFTGMKQVLSSTYRSVGSADQCGLVGPVWGEVILQVNWSQSWVEIRHRGLVVPLPKFLRYLRA